MYKQIRQASLRKISQRKFSMITASDWRLLGEVPMVIVLMVLIDLFIALIVVIVLIAHRSLRSQSRLLCVAVDVAGRD